MQLNKYLLLAIMLIFVLTSCQQKEDFVTEKNLELVKISGNDDTLIIEQQTDESDTQRKNENSDLQKENDVSDLQNDDTLGSHKKSSDLLEEKLDIEYNYTIKGESPDDFFILISNNPIDLRRKELLEDYDGSSRMIIEVASKYEEFWYAEIEVAYYQLLSLLDDEDRENLINSQSSWESYRESKKNIDESFFDEQKYNGLGSLRGALIIEENAEEAKLRAYSLLEYLYVITGEINMVFSSDEW